MAGGWAVTCVGVGGRVGAAYALPRVFPEQFFFPCVRALLGLACLAASAVRLCLSFCYATVLLDEKLPSSLHWKSKCTLRLRLAHNLCCGSVLILAVALCRQPSASTDRFRRPTPHRRWRLRLWWRGGGWTWGHFAANGQAIPTVPPPPSPRRRDATPPTGAAQPQRLASAPVVAASCRRPAACREASRHRGWAATLRGGIVSSAGAARVQRRRPLPYKEKLVAASWPTVSPKQPHLHNPSLTCSSFPPPPPRTRLCNRATSLPLHPFRRFTLSSFSPVTAPLPSFSRYHGLRQRRLPVCPRPRLGGGRLPPHVGVCRRSRRCRHPREPSCGQPRPDAPDGRGGL